MMQEHKQLISKLNINKSNKYNLQYYLHKDNFPETTKVNKLLKLPKFLWTNKQIIINDDYIDIVDVITPIGRMGALVSIDAEYVWPFFALTAGVGSIVIGFLSLVALPLYKIGKSRKNEIINNNTKLSLYYNLIDEILKVKTYLHPQDRLQLLQQKIDCENEIHNLNDQILELSIDPPNKQLGIAINNRIEILTKEKNIVTDKLERINKQLDDDELYGTNIRILYEQWKSLSN